MKTIKGHKIEAKHKITHCEGHQEAKHCHIIFSKKAKVFYFSKEIINERKMLRYASCMHFPVREE